MLREAQHGFAHYALYFTDAITLHYSDQYEALDKWSNETVCKKACNYSATQPQAYMFGAKHMHTCKYTITHTQTCMLEHRHTRAYSN